MSGIEALRADALAAAFDAFSIEVTLLAAGPFTSSKVVSGIWVQPVTDTDLGGFDLQSDRPSRILAVKRSEAEGINREARLQGRTGTAVRSVGSGWMRLSRSSQTTSG